MQVGKQQCLAKVLGLLIGLGFTPSLTAAVFQLEVSQQRRGDRLEVALDESFREMIISSVVGQQSSYLVNFEKSGRYVYRILREAQEIERDVVIVQLEAPPQGQLFKLSWESLGPQSTYRLSFSRAQGQKSYGASTSPIVYLSGSGLPWLLQVRAAIAGRPGMQKVDKLRLDVSAPPVKSVAPTIASPPILNLDPFASDDDQLVAEPEYRDLLHGEEKKWWEQNANTGAAKPGLKPIKRAHSLNTWLRGFSESFEINRRDQFASEASQGLGGGVGAAYFVQPTLQLNFDLDTHATKTTYEAGGTEPPAEVQKRIRLLLGVGVDVLNLEHRREDYSLLIGPSLAYLQLPLVKDDEGVSDFGLQITAVFYRWQLQSQLRVFKSQSYEANMSWGLPFLKWNLPGTKQSLRPFISPYHRRTRASNSGTASNFLESGMRLGLDFSF